MYLQPDLYVYNRCSYSWLNVSDEFFIIIVKCIIYYIGIVNIQIQFVKS